MQYNAGAEYYAFDADSLPDLVIGGFHLMKRTEFSEADNAEITEIANHQKKLQGDKMLEMNYIIETESGEFIGDCGITMQQVEDDLFHEIGYNLRKEYRGKGYATEAARACPDFAKSRGVKKIISYMKSDNLPSRHVAERNGMTFVKSFTKTVMGKTVEDEVLYIKDLNP